MAYGEAMNKLIYYAILGVTKPVAPIWFLLVARHFRKKARNVVYCYTLENRLTGRMKRLWERTPTLSPDGFALHPSGFLSSSSGRVFDNYPYHTPWWKFQLYFWLVWVWCDDDSVSDTYDDGHCRTFIDGERKDTWQAKVFGKWLDIPREPDSKAFDFGDLIEPRFKWIPSLIWQYRNTTMNLKYWNNY